MQYYLGPTIACPVCQSPVRIEYRAVPQWVDPATQTRHLCYGLLEPVPASIIQCFCGAEVSLYPDGTKLDRGQRPIIHQGCEARSIHRPGAQPEPVTVRPVPLAPEPPKPEPRPKLRPSLPATGDQSNRPKRRVIEVAANVT